MENVLEQRIWGVIYSQLKLVSRKEAKKEKYAKALYCIIYCIIKDEKRYADEVSDTTMLTIAVVLAGKQKKIEIR